MSYLIAYFSVTALILVTCGYLASSADDKGDDGLAIFLALFWPAWAAFALAFGPLYGLVWLGRYIERKHRK